MKKSTRTFLDPAGNQLEYCLYGEGNKHLMCFPGFGETYESFENLAEHLPDFTVVAVNLYFVGQSMRNAEGRYLKHKEWKSTLGKLLDELNIKIFSVLGYSLGGRFAISTFFSFAERMDHLILVAPDGIIQRITYSLATFPLGFRQVFYYLMKNPKPFYFLLNLVSRLRLVNSFTVKFAQSQLEDAEDRMRVYHSWVTFRYLRFTQKKLGDHLNTSPCDSTLIFGKKDKIIDPKNHLSFLNRLVNSEIHILPFGHYKLVDNSLSEIKRRLDHHA